MQPLPLPSQDLATPFRNEPRVLVVDDIETNRRVLTRLLARRGVIVLEAQNGEMAIETVLDDPPDLVLLDMAMPNLSGLDTLQAIRRHHDASVLPVIMITAYGERESAASCISAGANDFLSKPVQWPELRARIEAQLGMHFAHAALMQDNSYLEAAVAQQISQIHKLNALLMREFASNAALPARVVSSKARA